MPVYEYDCPACDHRFSRFFRSPDAASAPVACACGSADSVRAISSFQQHHSLQSQIDRIDPQFDRQLDSLMRPHQAADPLNRINMDFGSQVSEG